jgi:nicotinate-nucleotide adenylyltransferase
MGSDNLEHFHKWKNYEAILAHYQIYVYPRTRETGELPFLDHPHVTVFNAPFLDISATYIRETIREGHSVRYLVPDGVREYLDASRAYLD